MTLCNHTGCEFKGFDKWQHFGVCLGISLITTLGATFAAFWKEWKDSKTPGNHGCINDLLADALGIIVGTTIKLGVITLLVF